MLYLQIKEEIKTAMKNKDTEKRDVLKMVVDKAKAIVKEKNPTNVTLKIFLMMLFFRQFRKRLSSSIRQRML